jgi:hypothetical protein
MQDVFDSDPPFVAGTFWDNYEASLATMKGRLLVRSAKEEVLRNRDAFMSFQGSRRNQSRLNNFCSGGRVVCICFL